MIQGHFIAVRNLFPQIWSFYRGRFLQEKRRKSVFVSGSSFWQNTGAATDACCSSVHVPQIDSLLFWGLHLLVCGKSRETTGCGLNLRRDVAQTAQTKVIDRIDQSSGILFSLSVSRALIGCSLPFGGLHQHPTLLVKYKTSGSSLFSASELLQQLPGSCLMLC